MIPFTSQLKKDVDIKIEQIECSEASMITKSLYEENGESWVRGYLVTDSTFDKTSLDNTGIITVMYNDTLYSYRCPLTRINDLIKASGIKIIDIDKRIIINNDPI